MTKARRHIGFMEVACAPAWIYDIANQAEWNTRFISLLKKDYKNLDPDISAILSNERVAQECATKIRSYVDKEVTAWLYAQRKARGAQNKRQLEISIAGIQQAIELYTDRGNQAVATNLRGLGIELLGQLGRSKSAFETKRHGRDLAHSTLSECSSYLEERLGKSVTYGTLANLVNAGYEADGKPLEEPVTEEHIRKNLAAFRRNNPLWRNKIDEYLKLPPV